MLGNLLADVSAEFRQCQAVCGVLVISTATTPRQRDRGLGRRSDA